MKTSACAGLLSMSLLLTNCATILNGKYQQVMVTTNSNDAKVYVDNEYVGQGDHITTPMERDKKIKSVRVEQEGYKPENYVFFQTKKSPLYILSWVPFGILLYPPLYDLGPKSYNYEKTTSASCRSEVIERKEQQKYVYLQNTSFNLAEDDFEVQIYDYRKYKNNKNSRQTSSNEEKIELDNSIFTERLNYLLHKYKFIDTVNTVLKNKTNTMYLSADVKKVALDGVNAKFIGTGYLVAETTIDWKILDVYNVSKHSSTLTSRSGEFNMADYEGEAFTQAAVEDAITVSLMEFLAQKEVQSLLERETNTIVKMDVLNYREPAKNPNNLEDAMSAVLTITHEDGHGSGFFISNDGYIITNYHVVAGKEKLNIIMNNGEEVEARFIRANEFADLALLKADTEVKHAFKIPQNKNYQSGNEVFAIGTPTSLELGQTLSKGIVSGVRKQEEKELIQTDVSVNPGNSGGALVSKDGKLIGVVNSKVIGMGIEGIAFCTPAKDIFDLLSITSSGKISLR